MALVDGISIYSSERQAADEIVYDQAGTPSYAKRFLADTVGRVADLKARYVYMGDGDGWYHGEGLVINDDGSSQWMHCGYGGWYGVDFLGSSIDVAEELLERKAAYDQEQARIKAIQDANEEAYRIERGRFAYVVDGRKHRGRSGRIFWAGENQYGYGVGIDDGKERFFTAAYNVQIVPDPE